ncbi:MAG: nucleoside triphosphate pyrophosphohydrolase [Proteobacteria bacterium]|nr:nucleoside triphosphate pyrophosphohydrolase [Pseudomonadota bacterium]MDA0993458.1 nucleoside triphosphate pyrophosphohydrolase [Pseudomonadota bacterium]
MKSIEKLLEVMARLRDKSEGCPWDLDQNFSTIVPYTIEEAYEVADAIAREDMDALRDELGDLLFQVVFHAQMAAERGHFDFSDVAAGICEKMIRRHPHVFGNEKERAAGAAKGAWEQIKAAERAEKNKSDRNSAMDGVAAALPALKRAQKLGKRASAVGFDWPDTQGVRAKIAEELAELSSAECAGRQQDVNEELGDLLFAVVNLARHLKVDPEQALSDANRKFERRFRLMEADADSENLKLSNLDIDALELRWQDAKKKADH